jgi:hypothetical protein
MDRPLKAMLALAGLAALLGVLFLASGGFTKVFLSEDLEAAEKQAAAASDEIFEAAKIKAAVTFQIVRQLGSDERHIDVVVTYDFIPPKVDQAQLYRVAEEAVRKHFQTLGTFKVTNIARPSLPPRPALPPSLPAVDAGVVEAPVVAPPAPVSAPAPQPTAKVAKATKSAGSGTLTLFTLPAGAEVTLEGRSLGKTPLLKAPLPAGTKLLTLLFPDGKRKRLSAKIEANKLARFKFDEAELPDL